MAPRTPLAPVARGALLALLLGASACIGEIGDATPDGDEQPSGTSSGGPAGHGPSSATVLRRLNRFELANTVADLLGDAYLGDPEAVEKRLPSDPLVQGFDTIADALGTSSSFVEAAHGVIEVVVDDTDLAVLHPCDLQGQPEACAESFLDEVGTRALRRPLDAEERASYLALFDGLRAEHGDESALAAVLVRLLQSPSFLYHLQLGDPETGRLDAFELASRLSYLLWETMPDDALLEAAAAGKLDAPAGVEAELGRMLDDPRAKRTLQRFFELWFRIATLDGISKDPEVYPEFADLRPSMREEFSRYLEHVVFESDGDLAMLLSSPETFVDPALAEFYGVTSPGAGFEKVTFPEGRRAGILSQAAFLSIAGKANRSAPILRGVFVRERLLCATLPPPPPNAGTIPPELPSPTTTRDFFTDLTAPEECQSCHSLINPVGFGFENFDGMGRWRDEENDHPIDASGVLTAGDVEGPFDGPVELANRLATSKDVQRCLATQWFRFRFGRLGAPEDAAILDTLGEQFVASGGKLRELAGALARSEALYQAHFQLPEDKP
ncbi:MAG: DUF1592 domain-containing protein [Polyangiaceae bacterium]